MRHLIASLENWFSALPPGAQGMLGALVALTAAMTWLGRYPTVFALVAWPGTAMHEASHMLVGLVLGARPVGFSVLPRRDGDRWVLGSVSFRNLRWWNGPWTALAPLSLAPVATLMAIHWVYPIWAQGELLGAAWRLAFTATVLEAACPSRTDMRLAAPGLVVLGALAGAGWLIGGR